MNRITKFVFKNPELSIIAFAVVVRLITFIFYPNTTLFNDSENYLDLAKRLLEANLIGYEGYRTPGYSMLILSSRLSKFMLSCFNSTSSRHLHQFVYVLALKKYCTS